MLKIENVEVVGWMPAIRGMRNPLNSWAKSDSYFDSCENIIGNADLDLMRRLAVNGPVHAKYRRMLVVYADVTAPLYWWKEFDTYKVGTAANSCSTMHKIHSRDLTLEDFSSDHLDEESMMILLAVIKQINKERKIYIETKDKKAWYNMIQLLPTSYNQRRTIMLNYEVLTNIYQTRKDHRLDEWHTFCDWIRELPCFEIITGEVKDDNSD